MNTRHLSTDLDLAAFSAALIGGDWITTAGNGVFDVTDPATGASIAQLPRMGTAEVNRAIDAAQAALPDWKARTAKERSEILYRWYALIIANREPLARLLSREQGKPYAEALGEINYGASFFQWYAEEAKRVYGDIMPAHGRDKKVMVLKQPIGVTAGITPWNFPNVAPARKIAPALAAGCTMVLKPAEQTPLSALALAWLGQQAGLPPGVLNIVTGAAEDSPEIGRALTDSPIVRKLSFTGSTVVGKILMKQAAGTVKKLSLELGGNAPLIVFDDADIEDALAEVLGGKFRNAGQVCVSPNRILVQAGIYDDFARRLAEAAAKLKVGPFDDEGVQIGPLIDEAAVAKVEAHLEDACAQGARILTGGKRHALGGTFFEPTVVIDATPGMQAAQDETFGPVATLMRFDTEDEVLKIANDTAYGLSAYVFTTDMNRFWRMIEGLETGIVGVNTAIISTESAPFGGIKESGLGREGSYHGIEDWLEVKYVCVGRVKTATGGGA